MWFKEHCKRCLDVLGKEFSEVHLWLDALANKPQHDRGGWMTLESPRGGGPLNPYHRRYRHNAEGIEHVRQRWGDEAAEAAKLHILDDHFGPCPHPDAHVGQIPLNEADYVAKGWF